MSPAGPCVGDGGRVRLPSGKTLVDYDMDGGRVLVGRGDPEIDAASLIDGPVPREPFTAVAHLLGRDVGEVTAIAAAVNSPYPDTIPPPARHHRQRGSILRATGGRMVPRGGTCTGGLIAPPSPAADRRGRGRGRVR